MGSKVDLFLVFRISDNTLNDSGEKKSLLNHSVQTLQNFCSIQNLFKCCFYKRHFHVSYGHVSSHHHNGCQLALGGGHHSTRSLFVDVSTRSETRSFQDAKCWEVLSKCKFTGVNSIKKHPVAITLSCQALNKIKYLLPFLLAQKLCHVYQLIWQISDSCLRLALDQTGPGRWDSEAQCYWMWNLSLI